MSSSAWKAPILPPIFLFFIHLEQPRICRRSLSGTILLGSYHILSPDSLVPCDSLTSDSPVACIHSTFGLYHSEQFLALEIQIPSLRISSPSCSLFFQIVVKSSCSTQLDQALLCMIKQLLFQADGEKISKILHIAASEWLLHFLDSLLPPNALIDPHCFVGGMGVLADAIASLLLSIGSFSVDTVWVVYDCDSIFSLIMRSCIDIVFLFSLSQQALIPLVDPFLTDSYLSVKA
ncbi:hypothetical protein Tco_0525948 [Tanacetum coccineum]